MGLAAIDTDSATALRKIKALARSSEQMQAGFARLDARLRELAPQCAVAMETAKAAASDVAKAAKVAQDSLDALTHKRDERAMLIDGEPTGAHRTRHNELRRAARARLDVALEDSRAAANRCAGAEAAFVAAGERLEGARLACLRIQEDFEKALCESEIARERIHELLAVSVHDRDELRREIDVLRHALAEADAGLAQRRSDLDSLSAAFLAAYQDDVDADAMRAETEQKRAAVDDLQRRVGAIDSELAQDAAARASAATLSAEIAQARDELAVWQAVDEAIGSASGDKFRRFAQGITLDHLVQLANRQLATLAPRYGLSRTNASELGLSVVDRDMGAEKRGTRSLSGGERFLVSLSLAIALSGLEGRQSFVDTLFIDEGFGSLDAETLDIAVDALECLHGQGRKVGVITHVAAMIERIAVQVRVEKHGYGRSTIAIMGPGISQ
jgi:exonuclease SbcC